MNKNRKPRIVIGVIFVIVVIGAAGWYFLARPSGSLSGGLTVAWNSLVHPAAASSGPLAASGTVETTVISIAPEVPGKVIQVNFQEGDVVKAGDTLVHLDDTSLKIQRTIAATDLETAKMTLLQLTSPVALATAQQTIAQDQQNIDNAQQALDNQKYFTTNTEAVQNAQSGLVLAQKALEDAQTDYSKVSGDPNYNTPKAAAYQKLYSAQLAYNNALYLSNLWTGKVNNDQLNIKAAALALLKAKLAEDQTLVDVLNGGAIPENATGAGIVGLKQARFNVQVAQANLDLLDIQIGNMTVTAPVDGVVMTREAEPGSVVTAGAELLTLGRLDELTITVYVPEDSYGKIKLGQAATVTVDSFPGEKFNGVVDYISDQAEFTPNNVQTVAGRQTTVFAIRLSLRDISGKLKPGMPADVSFALK